jgi:hypothetical protein
MAALAGLYWGKEEDDFTKVLVKDGKLQMEFGRDEFHELKPFAPDHFHVADVPWGNEVDLHFVAAEAGKPRRLEQRFGEGKPDVSEAVTLFEPTAAEVSDYAGAYVSEEIDPIYRIAVQDGKLSLMRLKQKPDVLQPATRDVFTGDIGTLRFTRDANQKITGFILNAGRIQNFRFTKRAG